MFDLYFWPTPNCFKITIALEEMGLAYIVKPINIGKGEQFEHRFLQLSPNNRVPALVDWGSKGTEPTTIFESGAILQYLARKTTLFYPTQDPQRADVDQWLFWQVAGVGPMFGQASHFKNYAPPLVEDQNSLAYGTSRYSNETGRLLGVLNKRLSDRKYVCSDYSVADMALFPWIGYAGHLGQDLADFPHVSRWLGEVGGRPAVIAGMAVGSEFRHPPPAAGTDEHKQFAKALFGQSTATTLAPDATGGAQ